MIREVIGTLLPFGTGPGSLDSTAVVSHAFASATAVSHENHVTRREFRLVLLYIQQYLDLLEVFPTQALSGDGGQVDPSQLREAVPKLLRKGFNLRSSDQVLKELDAEGKSSVSFFDICSWALKYRLMDDLLFEITEGAKPEGEPKDGQQALFERPAAFSSAFSKPDGKRGYHDPQDENDAISLVEMEPGMSQPRSDGQEVDDTPNNDSSDIAKRCRAAEEKVFDLQQELVEMRQKLSATGSAENSSMQKSLKFLEERLAAKTTQAAELRQQMLEEKSTGAEWRRKFLEESKRTSHLAKALDNATKQRMVLSSAIKNNTERLIKSQLRAEESQAELKKAREQMKRLEGKLAQSQHTVHSLQSLVIALQSKSTNMSSVLSSTRSRAESLAAALSKSESTVTNVRAAHVQALAKLDKVTQSAKRTRQTASALISAGKDACERLQNTQSIIRSAVSTAQGDIDTESAVYEEDGSSRG
ncbi:hypothetical protein AAMO2058_000981300 [Amorphochlora amoebiformis]